MRRTVVSMGDFECLLLPFLVLGVLPYGTGRSLSGLSSSCLVCDNKKPAGNLTGVALGVSMSGVLLMAMKEILKTRERLRKTRQTDASFKYFARL